jgi:hypothetical protein
MPRIVSIQPGSVPPQMAVRVRLTEITDAESQQGFEPGLRFSFVLLDGPNAGSKCFRTIGSGIKSSNAAGQFLAGAFGRAELPVGQAVDIDRLLNHEFVADIATPAGSKGSRVERIRPVQQPAPPPQQPAPAWESLPAGAEIPF